MKPILKPICTKCGTRKTFWDKLYGINEWWAYKDGKVYCLNCAPENSRAAYIGMFLKYLTDFK